MIKKKKGFIGLNIFGILLMSLSDNAHPFYMQIGYYGN